MQGILNLPQVGKRAVLPSTRVIGSRAFDAAMALLSTWFVGGVYLDGWAHQHIPGLETFFTPWHAIMYSGFLAATGFLALTIMRQRAIPRGYELSWLGAIIFIVGGLGDMIWHILFGIEVNVEALLSPTHLVLALGGALIATGPLRSAWRRADGEMRGWRALWPALVSLTLLLSVFTFFTQFVNPLADTYAATLHRPLASGPNVEYYQQALGIASILLGAALWMGVMLLALRRWELPFGSFTLVWTANAALMTLMVNGNFYDNLSTGALPLIGAALLGGLAADLLAWRLKPSVSNVRAFRLVAFAAPAILYALYFLAVLLFGGGIWWKIHLWAGAIVLAGVVGWLLSYAFVPPASLEA